MIAIVEAGSSNTLPDSQNVARCNTFLSSELYVGVDWLQFVATLSPEQFQPFLDVAISSFSDAYSLDVGVPATRGKKYANSGRSVRGAAIAWNLFEDGTREVFVSLPASVLAEASLQEIWEISALLKFSYGVKFTRIDLRIDDYAKQLNPDVMLAAYQAGNYANFRTVDRIQRWKAGQQQGFTLYFGSPSSEKRARFYDKSAESNGRLDCYRLETQLRRGSAEAAMALFLDINDFAAQSPALLGALVCGAIDFPDRVHAGEREKNLDRCEKLPWWQLFLDRVGERIRPASARPEPCLEKTFNWIEKQVQISIGVVADVLGEEFFDTWLHGQLQNAKKRYRDFHRNLIKIGRQDFGTA